MRKKTHEEFLSQFKKVVNKEYVLLGTYTGSANNIEILHVKCGNTFYPKASDFLRGSRCPYCAAKEKGIRKRLSADEFEKRFEHKHKGEFILINSYKTFSTRISAKHVKCGTIFEKLPNSLLNTDICPNCNVRQLKDTTWYKSRVFEQVGEEYTVENEYTNSKTPIKMTHVECGQVFFPTPTNFLRGTRCPNCASSKGEKCIADVLTELSVEYEREKFFDGCGTRRFDFYIRGLNACIEFDGKLHYEAVEHFGGQTEFKRRQQSDNIKNVYCMLNDIPLLRIPYWDYEKIPELVTQFLNELQTKGDDLNE